MRKNAIQCKLGVFLNYHATVIENDAPYVERVLNQAISTDEYLALREDVRLLGVSERFRDVVDTFGPGRDETPAGFRVEYSLEREGVLRADLVRDIGCGKNGVPRPTRVLYSADCANPYEIQAIQPLIANVTTNPVIIYDRFLTNPEANVGGRFKTRSEVIREIARTVGSSADISVELNNPLATDGEILEEVRLFEELIPKHCLVIKVPHLGPLTGENIGGLVDGGFERRYNEVTVNGAFRCHEVALMLHEHGYRVNFTLMFEAHQISLALQARPSFINCFVRNRYWANEVFDQNLKCYESTGQESFLEKLRDYMLQNNYLSSGDAALSLFEVRRRAQWLLHYREWDSKGYNDGLDEARAALRQLRASNLPETRLIICSLAGDQMYALMDRMLMDEEFADMADRVVISVAPDYLAAFTSAPDVLTYNRGFALAARKDVH